ncbi:motility associated factor glycosyltransferase family protein [Schnuerera sp.]|uniref:motility associated factor glycosyltransferase family protein n=1 Tax=Schnuerera sp. TaxID=2794844 RepID=UPI002CCED4E1|nr:6-hydroxymethylpterin diphosphokinase MptE-like protein [Schnuerera sp.]HSH35689.1 6-hydroxymethylpterin diphosphokinase MptE-like protein [Schnuerera sp.]
MMLIDNINILKSTYPNIWNRLRPLEKTMDNSLVQVEETRRGDKTIWIEKDNKKLYLHSKYNPIREAEAIIEEYEEIEPDTTVIFYGTGLGYHIDLFLKKHPDINYYIYEPIPEMLYTYLSHNSLKRLPSLKLKDIILADNEADIRKFFNQLVDKTNGKFIHIVLNSHRNIFTEEYNRFLELFKETIKDKKTSMGTNLAFQERWILNSMKNFGEVLNTPNILLEKKGAFKNKPAILVAAGPSLNEEIENIRYIKENGLAYIFSVGSAINTLIYNNIYPDAATTYDPGEFNQNVFTKIKEREIKDIPMIFGSSVGYETLINYLGDKYHMITSQDTVSNYYLKNKYGKPIDMVYDAPTIAVVTLQLLHELGFNKIILVGQNLAYKGKKRHSEGIHYSKDITDSEIKKGIYVKDVYGEEILTNAGFDSMRQQMEYYIKSFPDMTVINTTKGGAHIEGTDFIELETVINRYLKEKVVYGNWLEVNKTNYDSGYLESQSKKMDIAYKRALKLTDEYYNILNRIERLIGNRNFKQAEKTYVKLDKILRKIENNDFFKVFILPMNRVQYELLANSIDSLNDERNPVEKGSRIVKSFKVFMDLCKGDMDNIDEAYNEMRFIIEAFLENNISNEG